jgi:hypothetical protein
MIGWIGVKPFVISFILELSVKSGKHGTRTLSLVQTKPGEIPKNPRKKYVSLQGRTFKLRNAALFVPN